MGTVCAPPLLLGHVDLDVRDVERVYIQTLHLQVNRGEGSVPLKLGLLQLQERHEGRGHFPGPFPDHPNVMFTVEPFEGGRRSTCTWL